MAAGRVAGWTSAVFMLLLLGGVHRADAQDDLVIATMEWSFSDPTTTLTVCATEVLRNTITLTVTPGQPTSIIGSHTVQSRCADFALDGIQPLPAVEAVYLLTDSLPSSPRTGTVTFALEGATIQCGGTTDYVRFSLTAGATVVDADCTVGQGIDTSTVCYVPAANLNPDSVCFAGLDSTHDQFSSVCVEITHFGVLTAFDGAFTADILNYETQSFTLSHDDATITLAELLSRTSDADPWTLIGCDSDTECADTTIAAPSETLYELCGVFVTAADGTAANTGSTSFQDLQLVIDEATTTVDFHFTNKNADTHMYSVYTYGDTVAIFGQTPFTLDCTNVGGDDAICNGFYDKDDALAYIAVSYEGVTPINAVIAIRPGGFAAKAAVEQTAGDEAGTAAEDASDDDASDDKVAAAAEAAKAANAAEVAKVTKAAEAAKAADAAEVANAADAAKAADVAKAAEAAEVAKAAEAAEVAKAAAAAASAAQRRAGATKAHVAGRRSQRSAHGRHLPRGRRHN